MLEKFTAKIIKKTIDQLGQLDKGGLELPSGYSFISGSPYHNHSRRGFIVSVTTRCNFNCPHCLRTEVDRNKMLIKDLPPDIFEIVLREGKKINFFNISFTGGEPILHPRFGELVSLVNKYGYRFNLNSNGWLYKEYWEIIKQNRKNLELIFLSLDGTTAEVHDAVRNKSGSFERLMEAIEFYKEKKIHMIITFCITKENYHQIESLPDFCLNLGINRIKWAAAVPVYDESGAVSSGHILIANERTEALQKIFNLKERFKDQCAFLMTQSFFPASNDKIYQCPVLDGQSFYIDHDGGMFFCCDINRECKNKPLIQKFGFKKALEITLDSANEMKKKVFDTLLCVQKITRTCDFCNRNIESCLDRHSGAGNDRCG